MVEIGFGVLTGDGRRAAFDVSRLTLDPRYTTTAAEPHEQVFNAHADAPATCHCACHKQRQNYNDVRGLDGLHGMGPAVTVRFVTS